MSLEIRDQLSFNSDDQSIFGTGSAITSGNIGLQPRFIGVDWNQSFNTQFIPSYTINITELAKLNTTFLAVAGGCLAAGWLTLGYGTIPCLVAAGLSDVTTPSVTFSGSTTGRIGIEPYLYLTSGDVDSNIDIETLFVVPEQIHAGETFTIYTDFGVLSSGNSSFETASPSIEFGVDFVLDIQANASLKLGASSYGGESTYNFFNLNTGEQRLNLLHFSSGTKYEYDLEAIGLDDSSLTIGQPVINTVGVVDPLSRTAGTPLPPVLEPGVSTVVAKGLAVVAAGFFGFPAAIPVLVLTDAVTPISEFIDDAYTTVAGWFSPDELPIIALTGEGDDQFAELELDLDALASKIPNVPEFGSSFKKDFNVTIAGVEVNLLSVDASADILDADLVAALSVFQDFSLEVTELPLILTLEDGSQITGFSLGDELTVTASADFDPVVDGNADGKMDFDVTVDIDAWFSNFTTLGFSLDLVLGLLKGSIKIDSDFFEEQTLNLFNTADGYLWSKNFDIFSTENFAELFDKSFDLEGFNTGTTSFSIDMV